MDDSGAHQQPEFLPEEWELVKELVFQYQTTDLGDLGPWLDSQSVPDHVRHEVERLLRAAPTCGDFLQQPAANQYLGIARDHPARIGPYRVIEEIGKGGMGVVYAAFDEKLNRKIAIKVLRAGTTEDPDMRRRLLWDAEAASALQHPNIVTVYDLGSDNGCDYIAMECINGQTLGNLIPAGGMETAEAVRCAIQIAAGLEAAHLAGVVHRDLKPGNIMITESGVVKLLDFGLAKSIGGKFGSGIAPPTIQGTFAGTVAYVSPEQAEGKAVDIRSDIFSFGSVLYEMVTGHRAFPGDHAISVLADILHNDPPGSVVARPKIDPRIDEILQRCLRKDRSRRFQSIGEVRLRLQEIEEEIQYARQDRSSGQHRIVLPAVRSQWRGIAMGALGATALCIAVFLFSRSGARNTASQQLSRNTLLTTREVQLVRATSDPGLTSFPALTWDNQFLVYASDRLGDGNLDLWLQQVKGSEPVHLTTNPSDDYDPVCSPDGTKVLFRSDREASGLYLMPLIGGTERLLAPKGRNGQFSPSGKSIAYWTGEIGGSLARGSAHIFIMAVSGGPPKPFVPDFEFAAHPVWSPDGKHLMFLGREKGKSRGDWWMAAVDGTDVHPTHLIEVLDRALLRSPPGTYWLVPTEWIRNGSLVLFSALSQDAVNVWAVELNQRGEAVAPPSRWTAGTAQELYASTAEVGNSVSLAFAAINSNTEIWQIPLNGHAQATQAAVPPQRLVSGFDTISSPTISSDGSRLAFSTRTPDGQAIRVVELPNVKPLVAAGVATKRFARPVLSGDGRTLAYWDQVAGYVMTYPDGEVVKLCEHCGAPTHLSFDGSQALFESNGSPEQLLLSSNRKPTRPLIDMTAKPSMDQTAGRFSPDGHWVVFEGATTGSVTKHLWIAPVHQQGNVRQEELVQLTSGSSVERQPYWSPDGRVIYYLSDRDGFLCIWGQEVDPSSARPRGAVFAVSHFHKPSLALRSGSGYAGDIGLSVSRKSIVFLVLNQTGNIWLQTDVNRPPFRLGLGF